MPYLKLPYPPPPPPHNPPGVFSLLDHCLACFLALPICDGSNQRWSKPQFAAHVVCANQRHVTSGSRAALANDRVLYFIFSALSSFSSLRLPTLGSLECTLAFSAGRKKQFKSVTSAERQLRTGPFLALLLLVPAPVYG